MWSTNLQHYLDDKGGTSQLPEDALELADHFGSIVTAVTLDFTGKVIEIPSVKCRNPDIQDCKGIIVGVIGQSLSEIDWLCRDCGDSGSITGWEDTLWDCSELALRDL